MLKERIFLFKVLNEYPQIVMVTNEGIYLEANILKGLEVYYFPTDNPPFTYGDMLEISAKCSKAFVKVEPVIKKWLVDGNKDSWMYFYHSSVVKMMDILCNGYIGVFDEIKQLEKIWREKGVDELVASAKMAEAKTPEEMQELLDFYITKIAPVGECII